MTTCLRHIHTNIQEQASGLWPENPKCNCGHSSRTSKMWLCRDTGVDIAGLHCLRRGTIQINTRQKKAKNCFCSLPAIENHRESKSCANCAPCQVPIPGRADAMAREKRGHLMLVVSWSSDTAQGHNWAQPGSQPGLPKAQQTDCSLL